jgi:hypothetical protein
VAPHASGSFAVGVGVGVQAASSAMVNVSNFLTGNL